MMADKKKTEYSNKFKQEMNEIIERLELSELQKKFMKSRWLEQLSWLSSKAKHSQKWYYRLRLMTIIGGVVIPAMVSLTLSDKNARNYAIWMTFGLSQIVAISAAVDEFFHHGDRWNQYRKTSELLKSEGWQFFQLTGQYNFASHAEAYSLFANRIENLIQSDVQSYVEMSKQKQKESQQAVANTLNNLQQSKLSGVDARVFSETASRSTREKLGSSSEELEADAGSRSAPHRIPIYRNSAPTSSWQQIDAEFSPPGAPVEPISPRSRRNGQQIDAEFSPPGAPMEPISPRSRRNGQEPQPEFSPPGAPMESISPRSRRNGQEPQPEFSPPGAPVEANFVPRNDSLGDSDSCVGYGYTNASREELEMDLTPFDAEIAADAAFSSDRENLEMVMTPPDAPIEPSDIAAKRRQDSESSLAAASDQVTPHSIRQGDRDNIAGRRRK